MRERYKCDRNGGVLGRYLQRQPWVCPSCGQVREWAGHICQDCRRRVCCQCFHHDLGACLTAGGSDVEPSIPIVAPCVSKRPPTPPALRWRAHPGACDACADLDGALVPSGLRPPLVDCENPVGCRCVMVSDVAEGGKL